MTEPQPMRTESAPPTKAQFYAVGKGHLAFTGQIVRMYVEGPWNREFVLQMHDRLRTERPGDSSEPWVLMVIIKGSALCGPDALNAIRASATTEARQSRRIATAWVVPPDVEGSQTAAEMARTLYTAVTPARVYQREEDAVSWLSAMLAMERHPGSQHQASLFARIGGTTGIRALVDDFYKRVLTDPSLARFFEGVSTDKLRRMQFELFSAALDGPSQYTGRTFADAHRSLSIGIADYQRFVRHLFATLSDYHMTEQERYEIIGRLNLFAENIAVASQPATGRIG